MWNGNINNISEVVKYINSELSKGRTQKDIELNDFGVNERVIAKRLGKRGYKKIDNQFQLLSKCDNNVIIKKDKNNSNSLSAPKDNNLNDVMKNLIKNYDVIMEIIKEHKAKKNIKSENINIIIELPKETQKDFRTSIRINNVIWQQFDKFIEDHKEFTKRDLLSMALKEYMENHK